MHEATRSFHVPEAQAVRRELAVSCLYFMSEVNGFAYWARTLNTMHMDKDQEASTDKQIHKRVHIHNICIHICVYTALCIHTYKCTCVCV